MAILTFAKAHSVADTVAVTNYRAKMILEASMESFKASDQYDIFLSHSIKDEKAVLGVKTIFENKGFKVYVDWIEDPQLDRSHVDKSTAKKIRERMTTCNRLIYLCTDNAIRSKWTPWELGFMDGQSSGTFILPIKEIDDNTFTGVEYLSIYPYIDFSGDEIYVNNDRQRTVFRR